MAGMKNTGRGRQNKVGAPDGPWMCGLDGLVQHPEKERIYDFGNSAILLTHAAVNGGETIQGIFSGSWGTVQTSRSSFAVTAVHAQLVLPAIDLRLPGQGPAVRTQPGSIYLSKNTFDVPAHLSDLYPSPNGGTFGPSRFYQAVFAMHAVFPFAQGAGRPLHLEPASVLLRTAGYVQRDGSLIASGIGTIITGVLGGLMFSCGHGSGTPVAPPTCNAVEPNSTWKCSLDPGHAGQHANKYSGHIWD